MKKSSSNISINKGCSSGSRVMVDSSAEESGWTLYFEDLLNDGNNINTEYFDDHEEKQSLELTCSDNEISSSRISPVSDAPSSASVVGFSLRTSRNLSFKKRKSCLVNKGSSMASDDSLEDTASSPVNSPKVSNLNQRYTMNRKQKEYAEIIQENTQNSTSTELKKRGLCLVPVSTIVNYLG